MFISSVYKEVIPDEIKLSWKVAKSFSDSNITAHPMKPVFKESRE